MQSDEFAFAAPLCEIAKELRIVPISGACEGKKKSEAGEDGRDTRRPKDSKIGRPSRPIAAPCAETERAIIL
jgi:hypothetical protein